MKKERNAKIGLILGILSIPAAVIPLFGVPIGVLGAVYSVKGMKESKGKSTAGLVCSIIGLIFSVANAVFGAYLALIGQNQIVNSLMG